MVFFTQFNESSIDISIKYWVPHFNYGNDVKSNLIMGIDVALKENNIVIPFPQQDLHIHTTSKGLEDIVKEEE
jgi:small-conductance mechanosensitive channel